MNRLTKSSDREQGKRGSVFINNNTKFVAGMVAGISVALIPVIMSRRDLNKALAVQTEEGYKAGFRHGAQCGISETRASSPDITTTQLQNICWARLMTTLEKGKENGLSRNNR